MEFSRQEYWNRLSLPSSGDLPNPGVKTRFFTLQADSFPSEQPEKPNLAVCVSVLVTHSCPTLCNPLDCSPQGSSVHGILQARILEWVAIPFFRGSSQPRGQTWVSCPAGRFFYHLSHLSSVQFNSVAQLCPTLFDPMDCSTPGLLVHHQLLEFTQTYVH